MTKNNDRPIRILCAVLFFLFSFCWFMFFQGDLTAAALSSLSHGSLSLPKLPVAIVLTLLLILLVIPCGKLFGFSGGQYAANYVPSAFILGAISGFDGNSLFPQPALRWIAAVAVCLAVLLVCKVLSLLRRSPMDCPQRRYAGTLAVMLLLFITAVSLANTDENLHRQLMMEKAMEKGNYNKVLEIGKLEEESTPEIDMMRVQAMLALPADNPGSMIGELLFNYPISDPAALAASMKELSVNDSANRDNILAAVALIERDLMRFDSIFDASAYSAALPEFFMQALVMTDNSAARLSFPEQYDEECAGYEQFCRLLDSLSGKTERYMKNSTFIDFHNTYYWYYRFAQ